MTQKLEIYKCNICGNIVKVVHEGAGELVCCNQPMVLQTEKNNEEGLTEKHLPVMEKTETGVKIKLGSIPHPMEEGHFIEWVEMMTENGKILQKFLKAGEAPVVDFKVEDNPVWVRAYCNLHGLWKKSLI